MKSHKVTQTRWRRSVEPCLAGPLVRRHHLLSHLRPPARVRPPRLRKADGVSNLRWHELHRTGPRRGYQRWRAEWREGLPNHGHGGGQSMTHGRLRN